MKSHYLFFILLFSISFNAYSGQFVLLNESEIATVKASLKDGSASKATKDAYKRLIKDANKLLDAPNYSVVDKTISPLPPGTTANDFISISSKWWPNENKADGLPWKKLGDSNPDNKSDKTDQIRIENMAKAVYTLSQAYYFSDTPEYAEKASTMIKVWFLANKTRMNPHLQYAQTVPGVDKRSSSGIMDGRFIPLNILDSINLIRGSQFWPERFDQVMNQWLSTYLHWLTGSKMGHKTSEKETRHGSWYYFQTSALAWYLNDEKALSRQFKRARGIMSPQFNGKGAQPEQLKRSKPFRDSCFNLEALTNIGVIAEKANKKFWNHRSTIAKGVTFLLPVAQSGEWEYEKSALRSYECLNAFANYAEYADSAEAKTAISNILTAIDNKGKKSGDEKRAYARIALYKPHLLGQ